MRILDSRRVRGPSLASRSPGAIAEVALEPHETAERAELEWRRALEKMAHALGRPELASNAVVRPFAGGLALMIPAPIDALYAAADLSEHAIAVASARLRRERQKERFARARRVLAEAFAREALPGLLALQAEAARRALPFVWDDDLVTLGLGGRSQSFAIDALPAPEDVRWDALGAIPVALVTGTNGKTTTTRLVARMAKLAGRVPGHTSSDGVAVDERLIERGDWTGAEAARLVLRHADVEVAILETARGGILRRGLAIDRVDAAILTNIALDHLGEFGVTDLPTMARAKAVVAHAVRAGGRVILNAGDEELMALAPELSAEHQVILFALERAHVESHVAKGGDAFVPSPGPLGEAAFVHVGPDGVDTLLAIAEAPLTFRGVARYNIENALGAAALAWALGLPRDAIVEALRTFGRDEGDNPGRGLVRELAPGVRGLFDFGHNPAGLTQLYAVARTLVGEGGAITAVLTQGGDRSDADLAALGAAAAAGGAVRAVLWEKESLLRGRAPGGVAAAIRKGLVQHGLSEDAVADAEDENAAIARALVNAREGDLVVIAPHIAH